ncbi:hypothetical protein O6P43_005679 [Quillaja saponaria]|uniref:Uncharacterized protein n=1 Tax=Quillaja saponaria TaxID=32244 RepID=A0AAD7Q6J7_QUISA|nr:hypothetical protein O6P43_005679 [Quillaja saponaria]
MTLDAYLKILHLRCLKGREFAASKKFTTKSKVLNWDSIFSTNHLSPVKRPKQRCFRRCNCTTTSNLAVKG